MNSLPSLLAGVLAGSALPAAAAPVSIASASQVSSNLAGAGPSFAPVFSRDGRFLVFLSMAGNLATNDDRAPHLDVFARDLLVGSTRLVSVNSSEIGGGNDDSLAPSVSLNGRVAFESAASNLAGTDTNRVRDIFVRSLAQGATVLASVNTNGTSGNGPSTNAQISANGRWVVFESAASDLVPGDTNGAVDIFARDLWNGQTYLVSVSADGLHSGNGPSTSPSLSSGGRFVAFTSTATDLTWEMPGRIGEVYVRDIPGGTTAWASTYKPSSVRSLFGGDYPASDPVLSADGRYVAYKAGTQAVFRVDLHGGGTVNDWKWQLTSVGEAPLALSDDGRYLAYEGRAAVLPSGGSTNVVRRLDFESWVVCGYTVIGGCIGCPYVVTNYCWQSDLVHSNYARSPAMSGDGQRVAFVGTTNLSPSSSALLIAVRDFNASDTSHESLNASGWPVAGLTFTLPALSADGSTVAFDTADGAVVAQDFNDASDVFLHSVGSAAPSSLISERHAMRAESTGLGLATLGPNCVSADGRFVIFSAWDSYPALGDTNRWPDVFVGDTWGPRVIPVSWPATNPPYATNLVPVFPTISANGRYAAFALRRGSGYWPETYSEAVVRKDLQTGTGQVVAVTLDTGGPLVSGAALSRDGRFVAFESGILAGALVPGLGADPNSGSDIFVRDMDATTLSNRWQLATVDRTGFYPGNRYSTNMAMSPDAQWVVFRSQATDLTSNNVSGQYFQLYARHLPSRTTHLVSYGGPPAQGSLWSYEDFPEDVTNAVFSANSRYVAFLGRTTVRTYLHDLLHYTTNIATLRTNYVFTNDTVITNIVLVTNAVPLPPRVVCTNCLSPSLSGDGRLLAYQTRTNGMDFSDIQVKDLETDETTLISANRFGTGGGNGHSTIPQISPSGRYVVFTSLASDLVANDANGAWDVFVHDRWAQTTLLVSLNAAGTASANRSSPIAFLGPDGRSVVFQTFANDVAGADYNLTRDIFVVRLAAADSDGDGLDDDWEVTFFNDLSRDGTGDFDGDGVTDAEEFRYGTDPTNLSTVVRVLSVTTLGDTTGYARLLWVAVPNRLYRVQYKDSATDPAWVDLPGDIPVYNYTMGVAFVPMQGQPQRFYRVVLVP